MFGSPETGKIFSETIVALCMSEKAVIVYVELSLFTFCKYIGGGLLVLLKSGWWSEIWKVEGRGCRPGVYFHIEIIVRS